MQSFRSLSNLAPVMASFAFAGFVKMASSAVSWPFKCAVSDLRSASQLQAEEKATQQLPSLSSSAPFGRGQRALWINACFDAAGARFAAGK